MLGLIPFQTEVPSWRTGFLKTSANEILPMVCYPVIMTLGPVTAFPQATWLVTSDCLVSLISCLYAVEATSKQAEVKCHTRKRNLCLQMNVDCMTNLRNCRKRHCNEIHKFITILLKYRLSFTFLFDNFPFTSYCFHHRPVKFIYCILVCLIRCYVLHITCLS
jgi:hypothetical protein